MITKKRERKKLSGTIEARENQGAGDPVCGGLTQVGKGPLGGKRVVNCIARGGGGWADNEGPIKKRVYKGSTTGGGTMRISWWTSGQSAAMTRNHAKIFFLTGDRASGGGRSECGAINMQVKKGKRRFSVSGKEKVKDHPVFRKK